MRPLEPAWGASARGDCLGAGPRAGRTGSAAQPSEQLLRRAGRRWHRRRRPTPGPAPRRAIAQVPARPAQLLEQQALVGDLRSRRRKARVEMGIGHDVPPTTHREDGRRHAALSDNHHSCPGRSSTRHAARPSSSEQLPTPSAADVALIAEAERSRPTSRSRPRRYRVCRAFMDGSGCMRPNESGTCWVRLPDARIGSTGEPRPSVDDEQEQGQQELSRPGGWPRGAGRRRRSDRCQARPVGVLRRRAPRVAARPSQSRRRHRAGGGQHLRASRADRRGAGAGERQPVRCCGSQRPDARGRRRGTGCARQPAAARDRWPGRLLPRHAARRRRRQRAGLAVRVRTQATGPADVKRLTDVAALVDAELDDHIRGLSGLDLRVSVAADAADLGTFTHELSDGGRVDWDRRMCELHTVAPETFAGTWTAFAGLVHPDDLEGVRRAFRRAEDSVGELVVQYRVLVPGRSDRWIRLRGRAVTDMLGRPSHLVGAAYDASTERDSGRPVPAHGDDAGRARARRPRVDDHVRQRPRRRDPGKQPEGAARPQPPRRRARPGRQRLRTRLPARDVHRHARDGRGLLRAPGHLGSRSASGPTSTASPCSTTT